MRQPNGDTSNPVHALAQRRGVLDKGTRDGARTLPALAEECPATNVGDILYDLYFFLRLLLRSGR